MKQKQLGDRVPKAVADALKSIADFTKIPKQQLTEDAIMMWMGKTDPMAETRRNMALQALSAASKVRTRRLVRLEPRAVELLKHGGRLPVSRATRKRYQAFGCAVLGFEEWPKDILRHTAASYLIALKEDAGKVATMLGNSPKILLQHYHEIVRPEECAAFWNCQP